MDKPRKVIKSWKSIPTLEGAGVHLRRAFGFQESPKLDPFLLLDDFRSKEVSKYIKGFPWHPHRGIETITYMLEGKVEHGDSLGNEGVINPGGVQWMTAGSGIIHQEMPKPSESSSAMGGFQLWANLPASHKMIDPRYRDVTRAMIPEAELDGGVKVKIICGEAGGVKGPVQDIITKPEYLDVAMPEHSSFKHEIPVGFNAFCYVIEGRAQFAGHDANNHNIIMFGDGDGLKIETRDNTSRFLLVSGKPIGEPVAWYGPIVMNTREELVTAFEEYKNGTFIKK